MFTLMVISGFTTVIAAAVVGISPSMAPSVALLVQLMERFIWQQELAKPLTFTVTVTLKDTAITFTKEKCEWDSGLETATLATKLLTHTQAGLQCPGSSLKKSQEANSKYVIYQQIRQFGS